MLLPVALESLYASSSEDGDLSTTVDRGALAIGQSLPGEAFHHTGHTARERALRSERLLIHIVRSSCSAR